MNYTEEERNMVVFSLITDAYNFIPAAKQVDEKDCHYESMCNARLNITKIINRIQQLLENTNQG
jgi:hypothetical protein